MVNGVKKLQICSTDGKRVLRAKRVWTQVSASWRKRMRMGTSKGVVRYNERMTQSSSTYPESSGRESIAMQTSAQASNPYERERLQALEPYAAFVDNPQPGAVAVAGSSVETLANPSLRTALTASVERFDYTLADIAWISRETHGTHDGALDDKALLTVIEAIDPIALIICDEDSARACAHAYRTSINLDCATTLLIRPCACFTDLVVLLGTQSGKQRAWHILKETLGAL